jgi:hypothetical protein
MVKKVCIMNLVRHILETFGTEALPYTGRFPDQESLGLDNTSHEKFENDCTLPLISMCED